MQPSRIDYMWGMLQASPGAYDDYVFSREEFQAMIMDPINVTYEFGDGVGLLTLVNAHGMGGIQMALFDWEIKKRFGWFRLFVNFLFHHHRDLHKLLAGVTDDRQHARELVQYLGFSKECFLRKAHLRDEEYHDVELWGLCREDFLDRTYGPSEVYL
jgi:hypothetical protein